VTNLQTPAAPVLRRENKRSRNGEANGSKPPKQPKVRINTSIFVSGLPLDCTKEEIANVFSRYGVLNEDDAGEPRVKMYADEKTSAFKGQALITYFKPESVDLAIQLLDESALRAAEGKRDPIMKVQKAEFGTKTEGKELNKADHEKSLSQAETNKDAPPKVRTEAEKRRAQKRFAKMNK
jgi:HIV Tat-specific factor 1